MLALCTLNSYAAARIGSEYGRSIDGYTIESPTYRSTSQGRYVVENRKPTPREQQSHANAWGYMHEEPRSYYLGARYMHSFVFFDERILFNYPMAIIDFDETVKHSGIQMIGGNIFFGYRLNKVWSFEAEGGYYGNVSVSDGDIKRSISVPYLQIGAVANSTPGKSGWWYAGAGLGVAMPTISVDIVENPNAYYTNNDNSTSLSPLAALMAGYRIKPADRWFVDIGYKFSIYQGWELSKQMVWLDEFGVGTNVQMTNKADLVMNHSIQIGLAYEF